MNVELLMKSLAPVIRDFIAGYVKELSDRADLLALRLRDIETRLATVKDGEKGEQGVAGLPGMQGLQGERGEPGAPGKDAVVDIEAIVKAVVAQVLAQIPPPRDGQPGVPGAAGVAGRDGKDADQDAIIKAVLAQIPVPKDGKDGVSFEDWDVEFIEDRGYVLRATAGGVTKEKDLYIPFDAGIWESGKVYPKGAGLRRDGSWWIAQAQTSAQPGHDKTWKLAVKKGTDGRQGEKGGDGGRGPVGPQGPPGPARY